MFNLNTRDDENVFAQSPQRITLIIYSFLWSDRQDAGSAAIAGSNGAASANSARNPLNYMVKGKDCDR
ncbi:MAG TPA: hypothetical protein DC049_12975 [Spirochaetia bacterium]|nr:hypothetical protein [Spirochaetia bacterium]